MTRSFPGFSGSAEDFEFRSRFMEWLVRQPSATPAVSDTNSRAAIPRTIVQYWNDGVGIPADVKECIDSWRSLRSQGFRHVLFDDESARTFIQKHYSPEHVEAYDCCHHPAMRCDYFRLSYINRCGGFYVDADEVYQGTGIECFFADCRVKLQPLCYDTTTEEMVLPVAFLNSAEERSGLIFYVANDPIVAPAEHQLIRMAFERSTRLLIADNQHLEIQSTTGPGNLTVSLVSYAIAAKSAGRQLDVLILPNWRETSVCQWSLGYRNDERNWRLARLQT